ncbi:MAG TPA: M28 family peptidase, partial [Sphingobacteriaceae bacterium]
MNIKAALSCLLVAGATSVAAQQDPEWEQIFKSINTEVQNNSKAYATLGDATQKIGHRLTGSKNGKKAEEYAFKLLKSYGFKDLRYQPFQVESWSRGDIEVKIGPDLAQLQNVKAVSLAHSPVSVGLRNQLIDMGNGLEEDYLANPGRVNGRIALVYLGVLPGSKPGTKSLHRSEKTALAIKYGAKGIVIINTVPGGVLLTGTASVTGKLIPIPAVCIGYEDGMKLKEQLKATKHYADIHMSNFSGMINARNVIATLPGKDLPAEKIVVGGHLDSWDLGDGSVDNGIGSFSILDMARTFNVLKLQPKRTVEFVMFMGEEQGLLGSKAYVEEAMQNKSIESIRFMLNYDMTNDPKGYSSTSAETRELFQTIGSIAANIDTSFKNTFSNRAGLHSDHQPFLLQGVPTGGAAGGRLPNNAGRCYHADCDDFSLIDEQGMKNNVRFNSMLIYGLADAEEI